MKPWTTVHDINKRLQKEWQRGKILAAQLSQEPFFPWRIPLKHPSGKALSDSFESARQWLDDLSLKSKAETGTGYTLEWKEINHRQLGKNRIPTAAIFLNETDALAFLKKSTEATLFQKLSRLILATTPELLPWLSKYPLQVLEMQDEWPKILAVLSFLQKNPRPSIYTRQLDITGVDTKFMEQHKKLLAQLFDLVLSQESIASQFTGHASFEKRYGFKSKPVQIRFRLLDPSLYIQRISAIL